MALFFSASEQAVSSMISHVLRGGPIAGNCDWAASLHKLRALFITPVLRGSVLGAT